ncbi:MAG: chloramphenicol phosphotransferase CPT family protein [bacterium]
MIIFLNGPSSSGKTSIAKKLQAIWNEEPCMHYSIDTFIKSFPKGLIDNAELCRSFLPKVLSAYHTSIATIASYGINIIVDHILQEESWLEQCVKVLKDYTVLFVGVKCPLKILEDRERKRKVLTLKGVRYQFERIHSYAEYDMEVDTSAMNVKECAQKIKDYLLSNRNPRAFLILQERLYVRRS